MQKAQKIVINSIAFLIMVLFSNSYAQIINDDYLLLAKVVNYSFEKKESPLTIVDNSNFILDQLDKYYRHRFLKEKNIVEIIGYKYDENEKKFQIISPKRYKVNFKKNGILLIKI